MARSRHGLYGGINYRHFVRVGDYRAALDVAQAARPLRGSEWRPLRGIRTSRNPTKCRINDDQSVTFRLYQTDVVAWFPDNSFVIEGHKSVMTGQFVNKLIPERVYYAATQGLVYIGRWWQRTHLALDDPRRTEWCAYIYRRNPDQVAAACDAGHKVRLVKTDAGYQFDEESLELMEWEELDRAKARKVSEEYRFADYLAWAKAYDELDQHLHDATLYGRYYRDVRVEDVLDALRRGEFMEAHKSMPRAQGWINGAYYDAGVNMTFFGQLRAKAYFAEGATHTKSAKVLPSSMVGRVLRNRYKRS